nr:MAG TPA: hypothetical protein [Caudoviricetes sp.]
MLIASCSGHAARPAVLLTLDVVFTCILIADFSGQLAHLVFLSQR